MSGGRFCKRVLVGDTTFNLRAHSLCLDDAESARVAPSIQISHAQPLHLHAKASVGCQSVTPSNSPTLTFTGRLFIQMQNMPAC